MKIGLFTDSHYSSEELTCGNRYNSRSLQKIKAAFEKFKENNCELVICLGDIIDKEKDHELECDNLRRVSEVIKSFNIPFICLMGNHDAFAFTEDEFYKILGENSKPRNITQKNTCLIFLDTCYFSSGKHYMPRDSDWTDAKYPYEDNLREELDKSGENTWVFMHHNVDPTVQYQHIIKNADSVRKIIESSGKVKGVFQGHFHPGNNYFSGNVSYKTLFAMCSVPYGYTIVNL